MGLNLSKCLIFFSLNFENGEPFEKEAIFVSLETISFLSFIQMFDADAALGC